MKILDKLIARLKKVPLPKQWVWFVGLWLLGLMSAFLIAMPFKILFKFLR